MRILRPNKHDPNAEMVVVRTSRIFGSDDLRARIDCCSVSVGTLHATCGWKEAVVVNVGAFGQAYEILEVHTSDCASSALSCVPQMEQMLRSPVALHDLLQAI